MQSDGEQPSKNDDSGLLDVLTGHMRAPVPNGMCALAVLGPKVDSPSGRNRSGRNSEARGQNRSEVWMVWTGKTITVPLQNVKVLWFYGFSGFQGFRVLGFQYSCSAEAGFRWSLCVSVLIGFKVPQFLGSLDRSMPATCTHKPVLTTHLVLSPYSCSLLLSRSMQKVHGSRADAAAHTLLYAWQQAWKRILM